MGKDSLIRYSVQKYKNIQSVASILLIYNGEATNPARRSVWGTSSRLKQPGLKNCHLVEGACAFRKPTIRPQMAMANQHGCLLQTRAHGNGHGIQMQNFVLIVAFSRKLLDDKIQIKPTASAATK